MVALIVILCFAGCVDHFGEGGTGELVIPDDRLRNIDPVQIRDIATPIPASQPAAATQPAPAQVRLSIADCRRYAIQNNLDLKVELINPAIARETLNQERAIFDSLFTTDANFSTTKTPTASQLVGSRTKNFNVNPGVQVPLQTGGILHFNLNNDRFETDNQFSTLNPAYTSDFAASLSQPLLRGAGTDAVAQPIRVAFYEYQAQQAATKLEVIRVLADADRVYWRLYAARQELDVRKKEYALAVAQLERARRESRAGMVAEVEIVRAESGVADKVEAIITADNALRDRQRDLKRTLSQPGLEMNTPTEIIPLTEPTRLGYNVDSDHLADVAVRQRMEMLELELRIAEQTANVRAARNGTLPLLSLNYTYGVNGLGSEITGALNQIERKHFEDHTVGIHLEVPIGNEAARSRLRQAILNRLQQLATKEQRTLQIRQEVYNATDALDAAWQSILASRERVRLAARVVEAETRQFDLGLRTSTEVLDAQTRLANAQSSEIGALTGYQIAQVDIAFATGTLLGASRVICEPAATPRE